MKSNLPSEGTLPFGDYQTWYRIFGDASSAKTPVVAVHGGPGFSHDYIEPVGAVADSGHAVILYDQLGNGRSTQLLEQASEFWTIELFRDQFFSLIESLGIADDFILYGQSWGAMLASEIAVTRPAGLKGLILSNGLASSATWASEAATLVEQLPEPHRSAIQEAVITGTFSTPEFLAANDYYLSLHGCRLPQPPAGLQRSVGYVGANPTIYNSMWGVAEFVVTGSLRDWSIVDRLHQIAVPTLVLSGRHDEATPTVQSEFVDNIPNAQWRVFENSSHMPFFEEPDAYRASIVEFLENL